MTTSIFYTIFIGILISSLLIIYQNRKSKIVKQIIRPSLRHELIQLEKMPTIVTKHNWCVIVRSTEGLNLVYQDDDLGKIGYHVYTTYKASLFKRQILVYIKNNIENRYLKIVTDGSSESMIGVNHPLHGHIGYLSFEVIE